MVVTAVVTVAATKVAMLVAMLEVTVLQRWKQWLWLW
jgi:hypothetical protein